MDEYHPDDVEQCHDWNILHELKNKIGKLEERLSRLETAVAYLIEQQKTEDERIRLALMLHDFYTGRG